VRALATDTMKVRTYLLMGVGMAAFCAVLATLAPHATATAWTCDLSPPPGTTTCPTTVAAGDTVEFRDISYDYFFRPNFACTTATGAPAGTFAGRDTLGSVSPARYQYCEHHLIVVHTTAGSTIFDGCVEPNHPAGGLGSILDQAPPAGFVGYTVTIGANDQYNWWYSSSVADAPPPGTPSGTAVCPPPTTDLTDSQNYYSVSQQGSFSTAPTVSCTTPTTCSTCSNFPSSTPCPCPASDAITPGSVTDQRRCVFVCGPDLYQEVVEVNFQYRNCGHTDDQCDKTGSTYDPKVARVCKPVGPLPPHEDCDAVGAETDSMTDTYVVDCGDPTGCVPSTDLAHPLGSCTEYVCEGTIEWAGDSVDSYDYDETCAGIDHGCVGTWRETGTGDRGGTLTRSRSRTGPLVPTCP